MLFFHLMMVQYGLEAKKVFPFLKMKVFKMLLLVNHLSRKPLLIVFIETVKMWFGLVVKMAFVQ